MNIKDCYWEQVEEIKSQKKALDEKAVKLKEEYIESTKPCNIGDIAIITLKSGRIVKGEVISFGILSDGCVHVTSYKDGSQRKYITDPNLNVKI